MPTWLMNAVVVCAIYIVWWLIPMVAILTRRVTTAEAARRRIRTLIVGVVVLLVLTVWASSSTPEGCTPDDCLLHPAIVIVPSFGFAIVWMTVSAVATAIAEPTLPESGTDPVDASRDEQ